MVGGARPPPLVKMQFVSDLTEAGFLHSELDLSSPTPLSMLATLSGKLWTKAFLHTQPKMIHKILPCFSSH